MTRPVLALALAGAAASAGVLLLPDTPEGPAAVPATGPGAAPVVLGTMGTQTGRSSGPARSGQVAQAPRWRWPARPRPAALREFRAPASSWGAGHRGMDLALAAGSSVLAVEGGIVSHAGAVAGRSTVTVRHEDGLASTYEPLVPTVRVGEAVDVGAVLGSVAQAGATEHCGVRSCLHLGAVRDGTYLDPRPLLRSGRVRLLPRAGR